MEKSSAIERSFSGSTAAFDLLAMRPEAPADVGDRDVLPALIKTVVGTRRDDGSVAVARREKPFVFLYGPYWRLPQGCYRLKFTCEVKQPLDPRVVFLGVEVLAQNRVFVAVRDYCAAELSDGLASIVFEVPAALAMEADAGDFFEFRFLTFGMADFAITSVVLASTDGMPDPTPLRWRLVSRLRRGILARRRSNGVRLVTGWFGGKVLSRPKLALALPEGTYRLSARVSPPVGERKCRFGMTLRVGRGATMCWALAPREPGGAIHEITFEIAGSAQSIAEGKNLSIALWQGPGEALTVDEVEIVQVPVQPNTSPRAVASAIVSGVAARIVIVGNCQAELLGLGLRAMLGSPKLEVHYHFVGHNAKLHDNARRELLECDVLFAQDIADFQTYPLRSEVPDRVTMLRFPMLRLATPWPFDAHNGLRDMLAERREAIDPIFPNLDGVLARLRRDLPDHEARFAAYAALECDGIVDLERMANFESRRLLAMDRQHGCGLGARILEDYRRRQIFHSIGHPGGKLLVGLIRHMCRLAHLRSGWLRSGSMDQLRTIQIPVHPIVAKRLGIKWATRDTRYNFRGESLTWEQYTRRYINHFG